MVMPKKLLIILVVRPPVRPRPMKPMAGFDISVIGFLSQVLARMPALKGYQC